MSVLPKVEFEEDDNTIQGDILGFVPVGYKYPSLPLGQVRSEIIEGGTYDDKCGFVGGYIENPTIIFVMVGCDDGKIRRVFFHKCRYLSNED